MAEIAGDGETLSRKLHPFFSAPGATLKPDNTENAVTPPTPDPSCHSASDEPSNDHVPPSPSNDPGNSSERKRKRRKTDPSSGTAETLPRAPRRKRPTRISAAPNIMTHFGQHGLNEKGPDVGQTHSDQPAGEPPVESSELPSVQASKPSEDHLDAGTHENSQKTSQLVEGQKSRKLLRFNPATGTIGSPPRPKPPPSVSTSAPGKKRGRKPKAMVVTVSYGENGESRMRIGLQINGILSGTSRNDSSMIETPNTPPLSHGATSATAAETTVVKTATLEKPAHPFFQAKSKAMLSAGDEGLETSSYKDKTTSKRHVIFSSTPCSPREARLKHSNPPLLGLGSKKGRPKVPGAQHPAWPWHGMVHIRDSSPSPLVDDVKLEPVLTSQKGRKAKGQAIHIAERENILNIAASNLMIHRLTNRLEAVKIEDFRPPSLLIRVPIKHFESGRKLQTRVLQELRTLKRNSPVSNTHTGIMHAYDSIAKTLSAFDRSTCEPLAWTQKYAPTSACRVLQDGREAELLRDWLRCLKVQAVDTGASDSAPKSKTISARKQKRKHKKLDGFVVSSDEEANEMGEISDNEPQWLEHGSGGDARKTVMRSGDMIDRGGKPIGRLANAVLLSGPHGCGKSATVYAIAKELGFEVFEINAGARRSGKDILERVGDMTKNHLVSRQQKDESREDGATDDEVTKDLNSGKQGMMTSFFKPNSSKRTKEHRKADQTSEAQGAVATQERKLKDQKQSLILLEEVDVLYEEDRQFWATVISMIAHSKRPFIMTCNNESVVPFQNLRLHGIFRFSSPSTDLAVDMLLLIAANEGHIIRRRAVEALYESRGHDFRAAITELNYWCQMGVGDPRGGFNWFYPRWPKGGDVDEEGQTIRVISEDTYHTGMGWLNRDLVPAKSSLLPVMPDLHQEAWDDWGIDISDHPEFGNSRWVEKANEEARSPAARLAILQSVEAYADSMSDSDLCGPFLTTSSNHIALDATMPNLHTKTLEDFTIGNRVLEVMPLRHYNSISLGVSISLRLLAQSKLVDSQLPDESSCTIRRFDELCITDCIEQHVKRSLRSEGPITRKDYSIAFDPIAASEKILANGYLSPSIFDREMTPLCVDVAPYVRSIVSYDQQLHDQRRARSTLLSEGGRPEKKRMRTTRAALSALEGGSRATTRGERYFAADINPYLVMRTGGKGWAEAAQQLNASVDATNTATENHDQDMEMP
ncbi:hypothetical protein F4777DRAFT_555163 [Nemania sp. FL0916]|nr:hypothetical protein F4777DRAFT_555163 [Nemania sp. FL0916]